MKARISPFLARAIAAKLRNGTLCEKYKSGPVGSVSMADASPFAEGRSAERLSVDGVRCPRAWSRKPCSGRRVEKASRLTKEPRMKSSVASPSEGHGVIAMAGRRGRGVPPSKTPQWSAVRRAGLRKDRHVLLRRSTPQYHCAFTALRSLFGSEDGLRLLGEQQERSRVREQIEKRHRENSRGIPQRGSRDMREKRRGCLKIWIGMKRE